MTPLLPGRSVNRLPMFSSVFLKCSGRYWQQHRWQAALMLIGMALGVAVVFAVDIANDSAKRGFALSLDTVTGRTTHQIIGTTEGLDESVYTRLRTELAMRTSAPVVEGTITLQTANPSDNTTETLQLLGVDIFAEPMFRDQSAGSADSTRDSLKLLQQDSVILADTTAARLGIKPGDSITVDGSDRQLTLLSTVITTEQPGFESIAMVDIATAQQLLNKRGLLSRIDLILSSSDQNPESSERQLTQAIEKIKNAFPDVTVIDATRRNNSLTQLTQAFHTNLLAMSLLALLVGAFLIYNTVTLSVIQRRKTFGQLRAVGIQRHELFWSILTETLLFAAIGTLAGIILGYLLGSVLLTLVTRTINDLYFTLDVRQVSYSALTALKACVIGLGTSLLAALAPAIEAARSSPVTVIQRTTVEKQVQNLVPVISLAGVTLLITGFVILWISKSSLWAGFVAIFCIVLGYSLIIPRAMIAITAAGNYFSLTSFGTMGNYPLRSMTASLSRTAVAIAALAISVSATAGVGIMIDSFRLSVESWLDNTLQADVYISNASDNPTVDTSLPDSLIKNIQSTPGVTGTRMARMTEVDTNHAPARLLAIKGHGEVDFSYEFKPDNNLPAKDTTGKHITDEERVQSLFTTDAVIASEPYARKNNLSVGDVVNITTDKGIVPFHIAGVFTNYTTGKGLLVMSLPVYNRYWSDQKLYSIGVNLSDDASSTQTTQALRALVNQADTELVMRSDADIREQSLEIFDRTFAITHVLRLLTVGVAFVGILSALMALSLERRAEYAVLRALGITPAELRKLLFLQTGLMGVIAGVLALPLGIAMSQILVSIINVRSFGWSMEYHISSKVLLESLLLAIVAALLAGLYPAIKLGRLSPAEALRHQ